MLTIHRIPHQDQEALLVVIRWWQRIHWTRSRALLSVVACLHLLCAYTLVFAPDNQLFTQGTRPVFDLFPPGAWVAPFLAGGLAATSLLFRYTVVRQLLTWFIVWPTQTVWVGASVIAVKTTDGGSALGVVFLLALLAFTSITAVAVALDYTSGKR